jgi:hypothetical protein
MKASRNYWIDLSMAALALILVVSSVLLWVVLPQGYFRSRLVWLEIHKWSGLAVTLAVLLHLVVHRSWLWTMTQRHFGRTGEARPSTNADQIGSCSLPSSS